MSTIHQNRNRTTLGLAAALVALAVVVMGTGVVIGGEPSAGASQGDPEALRADVTHMNRDVPAGPGQGREEPKESPPPAELLPMPTCWEGVVQFDQKLSFSSFRAAVTTAVERRDEHMLRYLEERLTEMVGSNVQHALQVLAWAEEDAAAGVHLMVYMEGLKKAPAAHDRKVVDRLLQIGENGKSSVPLRAAAMVALETQKKLDAATLGRLKAIALNETLDDQISWNATRTIGRVMAEDFERTGNFRAYWEQLLDIGQRSQEPRVRLLALEMPSYSSPILEGESIDSLSRIMRTDRDRLMREMAALRISHTDAPEKALDAYREAFATEHDLCVRWALMRFAMRVGGASALPLAQQFAAQEPRLQQDYVDFKEIYAQGALDWERVWLVKKNYHDNCIAEEGAPHG